MASNVILGVSGLNLYNRNGERLVQDVSLSLRAGESLGLVGESGSGKTLTLRSLIGLLPEGIGQECASRVSNDRCAMIFQNPQGALDPLCPVGRQLTEIVRLHERLGREAARAQVRETLRRLALPENLLEDDRYPFELSGGQCQRVLIAMAQACRPQVLLCDEPTTALDVVTQRGIIATLKDLAEKQGVGLLLVSHDLPLAASAASRLYIMKDGRLVEEGEPGAIVSSPRNPHTRALVRALLDLEEDS